MGLKSQKILGISVTTDSKETILEYIEKYLGKSSAISSQLSAKQKKPLIVATPNPEQIVLAQRDKHFAQILNEADVAIPDGVGLVTAMWLLEKRSAVSGQRSALKRIPGVEFMEDLVRLAAERGYPVALIGGRAGVAAEALECLQVRNPGPKGWAMDPGELHLGSLGDLDNLSNLKNTTEKIRSTGTRLVFVGLGAPKQEYFIEKLKTQNSNLKIETQNSNLQKIQGENTSSIVLMSVGGSFDIIAGKTPRAPLILRAIGVEWLWRLVREPWRWRRQVSLVQFLWLVLGEKFASQGPSTSSG
ncbi:hypothetical protein A2973_04190 [Candidatus Gottesmanbacteria bacterium RIFCSPLOWO2_01_FULL_49_10]|uniref:Uncharacterized protein n=1 Tax=Candidatus Gottesmanbacteria bacterium RIFCSPLOWO2_01_FULL_49_10 TaxID=1798396 RepID=A0A1F6AXP6_9BACT|nr:MAG: hypothetical protein A2973_04190 [Candidatus Gottesmanbacteria bacterium RIFCSPLOWO2_01_FULL_49_10]